MSSILLGVEDMDRTKRFYGDGLGWQVQRDYGVSVFYEPDGGSIVGFYGRDGLAANVGVSPEGNGFSGVVFTYVVRSEPRVDEIFGQGTYNQDLGVALTIPAQSRAGDYTGTLTTTIAAGPGA